jgi:hypothetical protein
LSGQGQRGNIDGHCLRTFPRPSSPTVLWHKQIKGASSLHIHHGSLLFVAGTSNGASLFWDQTILATIVSFCTRNTHDWGTRLPAESCGPHHHRNSKNPLRQLSREKESTRSIPDDISPLCCTGQTLIAPKWNICSSRKKPKLYLTEGQQLALGRIKLILRTVSRIINNRHL